MAKRCLIIAYHFYPSGSVGAKRFNLFSAHFSQKMQVLDILTIKEKYSAEKDYTLKYGGNVFRTRMYPRYMYNGNKIIKAINNRFLVNFFPIDFYSAWIIPALFTGIKIIKKDHINTIIVTGPPFSPFLTAYLLCIFFKIDLIIDYQDPWVLADDYNVSFFKKKYTWFLEKLLLKKSKKIIFNTPTVFEKF